MIGCETAHYLMKKQSENLANKSYTSSILKEIQRNVESKISDMYGSIAAHETVDRYIEEMERKGVLEITVKRGDTRHLAQYCHLTKKGYLMTLLMEVLESAEDNGLDMDVDEAIEILEKLVSRTAYAAGLEKSDEIKNLF
ncbi:MAG: hypothetical protein E7Z69_04175 [Thermoplasmata archaeon]|nr:hypothetical protein [Thermoplasmata archaeon]